jgi:antitoxin component of MazEF toxin-antitoxin module
MLIKRLCSMGDSEALILPNHLRTLCGMGKKSLVQLQVQGSSIILTPVSEELGAGKEINRYRKNKPTNLLKLNRKGA